MIELLGHFSIVNRAPAFRYEVKMDDKLLD
jgi:hypothetical protein